MCTIVIEDVTPPFSQASHIELRKNIARSRLFSGKTEKFICCVKYLPILSKE